MENVLSASSECEWLFAREVNNLLIILYISVRWDAARDAAQGDTAQSVGIVLTASSECEWPFRRIVICLLIFIPMSVIRDAMRDADYSFYSLYSLVGRFHRGLQDGEVSIARKVEQWKECLLVSAGAIFRIQR